MVAGDRQRQRIAAVAQGDQACLAPDESFLDDHRPRPDGDLDRPERLLQRVADRHALAGGEPVRLDDDAPAIGSQPLGEGAGLGGRR